MSSLVQFGARIATVPDGVIHDLMECFAPGEPMVVEDSLGVGMEVTVAQGPFLGFRGLVTRVLPARQRVQVLLDFLGRTTLAEVDRSSVVIEDERIADILPALALSSIGAVTDGYRASA